jgi:predicted small secreted protein
MRAPLKLTALVLAAVVAAAIAVAGCGGSSSGGGGDPASLAPEKAPVYLEVNFAPESKTSEEFNELTQNVLGIDNVGEFITEELEQAALGEGEKFNFEEEVEPWLGEKAGMYLTGYDGDQFNGYGVAIETTNSEEAEQFVEKRVASSDEEAEEGEFEGTKYWVEPDDESVIGVIDSYLAFGETKADFEEMVKISEGSEGLNESEKFKTAMDGVENDGIGSVYVDIGGLIQEAKGLIPSETEAFFDLLQIEPKQATAVASVIPHSEQIELDLSSTLGQTTAPSGDATSLLESLPATSIAAFASPEVGTSLKEGIDELDEQGIPGQIPPGELKSALESVGINLDSIAESVGDVGAFVEGSNMGSLGGAMVVETSNGAEAKKAVGNIGLLLHATGTPGVTAITGNFGGFSVRSAELGSKPLIIGAAGEKIVIAYGPKAAAQALRTNAKTLGTTADFEAAKGALGSTPMTAFIDGGPTLKLVDALLTPEEKAEFAQAKPYLRKITYAAVASEPAEGATNAKVILGLQK